VSEKKLGYRLQPALHSGWMVRNPDDMTHLFAGSLVDCLMFIRDQEEPQVSPIGLYNRLARAAQELPANHGGPGTIGGNVGI
jgi:hypothetical protein